MACIIVIPIAGSKYANASDTNNSLNTNRNVPTIMKNLEIISVSTNRHIYFICYQIFVSEFCLRIAIFLICSSASKSNDVFQSSKKFFIFDSEIGFELINPPSAKIFADKMFNSKILHVNESSITLFTK